MNPYPLATDPCKMNPHAMNPHRTNPHAMHPNPRRPRSFRGVKFLSLPRVTRRSRDRRITVKIAITVAAIARQTAAPPPAPARLQALTRGKEPATQQADQKKTWAHDEGITAP